jgi:cell division protein FtsB
MDAELQALEEKLAALIAHTRAIGAANESLRDGLAKAQARNQALASRMREAGVRLDELMSRLPAQ